MVTNGLSLVILMFTASTLGVENSSEHRHNGLAGRITAVVGRGFSRTYPSYIFADSHWDFDERYRVSLRTSNNKELFSNTWISLDHTGQKIIGFPMDGNEGQFKFLLRAVNRAGQVKTRKIQVDVLLPNIASVHNVIIKLSHGFRTFIQNLNHRILFASIISKYLRQNGIAARMGDIWVTSIETQEFTISWALATYNKNSCNEVLTKQLPKLLFKGNKPHPILLQKLRPLFSISHVRYESDVCSKPRRKYKPPEQKNLIIGPLLIIIIMIGLSSPIFIAYLIRRGRRKREFRRAADVRHVYSNGVATLIVPDTERSSEAYKSHDDISYRKQYRWSPDMRNRVPVQIPSCPPPKPTLCQTGSQYNSLESTRSTAWHGLPNSQCAESDGIQLANIVNTISQSATTLKSYFMASNDRGSVVDGAVQVKTEDDAFSIKSEGSKIFESAMKKLSSVINTSYFSAPTLIRISGSDVDEDEFMTRKSSIETRNSSFEQSVVSSDQPTPSLISSDVNSLDTEAQILMTSFSQDESLSEDLSIYSKDENNCLDKDEITDTKAMVCKALESQRWYATKSTVRSPPKDRDIPNERGIGKCEESAPSMKNSVRCSLRQIPQVQVQEARTPEGRTDKSDLLNPWYRDQANVRVQLNAKGIASQYCISKVAKVEKTAQRKKLQNDIIYECCYDEGFESPAMV